MQAFLLGIIALVVIGWFLVGLIEIKSISKTFRLYGVNNTSMKGHARPAVTSPIASLVPEFWVLSGQAHRVIHNKPTLCGAFKHIKLKSAFV